MGDKEKKKKDKTSDRVTLKKEIGLLSACAIIIGECVTAFVLSGVFMKCCSAWERSSRGNVFEQRAGGTAPGAWRVCSCFIVVKVTVLWHTLGARHRRGPSLVLVLVYCKNTAGKWFWLISQPSDFGTKPPEYARKESGVLRADRATSDVGPVRAACVETVTSVVMIWIWTCLRG